ncbi:hypothetical protein GQ41_3930 [Arenibacter algicola]|uniref:Uncharacterized protein n=1 Tax=Arenibacter algicola TaxID=616991 RepID=A0ABY3AFG3_9FLAO
MESIMVGNWALENNEIVKDYFQNNFPDFILLEQTAHGPFWGVKYIKNNIVINVKGDIGFYIEIIIDGNLYDLWQYDRSVNNYQKTSNENILSQLSILKSFLE